MIAALGYALALLLTAIAAAHFYWAFGGFWPAGDEMGLVNMVVGAKDAKSAPSGRLTIVVATAIEAAGLVAVLLTAPFDGLFGALVALAGAALCLIFLMRFAFGYLPFWRRRFSRQPFARLDRLIYSPLCLTIAMGFAVLVFERH
ncbi:MAG: DUF3995 domain-containing protein [Bradyrhizobium sp.]|nr:MAG: DUF3995 domain-containing protein [Bradyrhizobium sp.]